MTDSKIVVLYHANCPDGFGGAYGAWKKFGEEATYLPVQHGHPVPEGLAGKELYFIDFCYPKEKMDGILAEAASLVILDHHEGIREVVENIPGHVYDATRSGTTIAWTYFHPDTPVPMLLKHVEDDDLFRFALPDTKAVLAYLSIQPYSFAGWDTLVQEFENLELREKILTKARAYREYFDLLVAESIERGKLVLFEGYECYLGESHPLKPMESAVGHGLANKKPPFALITHARDDGVRVSLRGDGSVDVAAIARKYGGNGHPSSAAFSIPWGNPIPWKPIKKET